jgi:hypothetical protein
MVAVPGAIAVTRPLLVTVATLVANEFQVTVRPVRAVPPPDRRVAVNC